VGSCARFFLPKSHVNNDHRIEQAPPKQTATWQHLNIKVNAMPGAVKLASSNRHQLRSISAQYCDNEVCFGAHLFPLKAKNENSAR
jgi:hypothetical protein